MRRMISVTEARDAIRKALPILHGEQVALEHACGRVLAAPLTAKVTQPPFNSSAMDGYAVRIADVRKDGAVLRLAGVSAAGSRYPHGLQPGEAVRIFTGAPVPDGADHILIQEEAEARGDMVAVKRAQQTNSFVRASGIDFHEGDILLSENTRLTGAALALAAAANAPILPVRKMPRVAIIANGNELVLPGTSTRCDQVISSIQYGLLSLVEQWGGSPKFLGIAADNKSSIREVAEKAEGFDIIVPVGGASVGDHDFMREVFAEQRFTPVFQGVAVKPGMPTWFSTKCSTAALGLPGNPASALVTATLFLKPAIGRLLAIDADDKLLTARAAKSMPANGARETYLRARVTEAGDGMRWAAPFDNQDSSLLSVMAQSNALVRREIAAGAIAKGELVEYLLV